MEAALDCITEVEQSHHKKLDSQLYNDDFMFEERDEGDGIAGMNADNFAHTNFGDYRGNVKTEQPDEPFRRIANRDPEQQTNKNRI